MAPSALRRFGGPYDTSRPLELVVKPVTVMLSATVSPCTLSIRSERGLASPPRPVPEPRRAALKCTGTNDQFWPRCHRIAGEERNQIALFVLYAAVAGHPLLASWKKPLRVANRSTGLRGASSSSCAGHLKKITIPHCFKLLRFQRKCRDLSFKLDSVCATT